MQKKDEEIDENQNSEQYIKMLKERNGSYSEMYLWIVLRMQI